MGAQRKRRRRRDFLIKKEKRKWLFQCFWEGEKISQFPHHLFLFFTQWFSQFPKWLQLVRADDKVVLLLAFNHFQSNYLAHNDNAEWRLAIEIAWVETVISTWRRKATLFRPKTNFKLSMYNVCSKQDVCTFLAPNFKLVPPLRTITFSDSISKSPFFSSSLKWKSRSLKLSIVIERGFADRGRNIVSI